MFEKPVLRWKQQGVDFSCGTSWLTITGPDGSRGSWRGGQLEAFFDWVEAFERNHIGDLISPNGRIRLGDGGAARVIVTTPASSSPGLCLTVMFDIYKWLSGRPVPPLVDDACRNFALGYRYLAISHTRGSDRILADYGPLGRFFLAAIAETEKDELEFSCRNGSLKLASDLFGRYILILPESGQEITLYRSTLAEFAQELLGSERLIAEDELAAAAE